MPHYATLAHKYDRSVPRYTSYPTVPFWEDWSDSGAAWAIRFRARAEATQNEPIGIYVHLPFCESLCTYCACNKKITTNHSVESRYLDAVLLEWQGYLKLFPSRPMLGSLHLGGGTPTFFSPDNLRILLEGIFKGCTIAGKKAFGFEGHPNNTTSEHLRVLAELGFDRVSYGVQDLSPVVQAAIGRIQPLEKLIEVTRSARESGYVSVNYDLIYGLPFQTLESIGNTAMQTIAQKPDRIAFYGYAHVPWKQRGQRLFDESDLPVAEERLALYLKAKRLFLAAGYEDIGMDHFALPGDALLAAKRAGSLHRNFMGYTDQRTPMSVGLGVSAIGDIGDAYSQNHKALEDYYRAIESGKMPWAKGYMLDEKEKLFKQHILDIICKGETVLGSEAIAFVYQHSIGMIREMEADGLLQFNGNLLKVTPTGMSFVRNVCAAFDRKWIAAGSRSIGFSKAV